MKRFLCSLLIVILLTGGLVACKKESVKDNVPVSDIGTAIDALLSNTENLMEMDADYIKGMMGIDTDTFAEYRLKMQTAGANIDEYGIFKAKNAEQLKEVEKIVQDYVAKRKAAWTFEYLPEEYPKLESADVKTVGLYVMYTILDSTDRSAVYEEFEKVLA